MPFTTFARPCAVGGQDQYRGANNRIASLSAQISIKIKGWRIWYNIKPWWRHQMETFSALLALCAENSPVTGAVNSCHKGQSCGALMFSLVCAWINVWVNNREAGYLRRHRAHYHVTAMVWGVWTTFSEFKPRSNGKSLSKHLVKTLTMGTMDNCVHAGHFLGRTVIYHVLRDIYIAAEGHSVLSIGYMSTPREIILNWIANMARNCITPQYGIPIV